VNAIAPKASMLAVLVLAPLSACGTEHPALTESAATTLAAQVAEARAAAASGDYDQASELLDQVDGTVAELRATGEISDARADDVLGATGAARDALTAYAATTTTASTTTTTTEPEGDENDNRGRDKKQDENEND
jgi:hypothetical protein